MTEIKFRNEQFRGSGIRDAFSVIKFELCELRNVGILTTLRDTIFKESNSVTQYLNTLIRNIDKEDGIDERDIRQILNFIQICTGKSIKYVLWLADMDIVMYGIYGIRGGYLNEYDTIDAYKVGTIVLADLGDEGKLYGYEELPKPFANIAAIKEKSRFDETEEYEKERIFTCMS